MSDAVPTAVTARPAVGQRLRLDARAWAWLVLAGIASTVVVTHGLRELAQASINGLVTGAYAALGAVGLTLVFGVLRLVNFAHGEFLTLGAYVALFGTSALHLPFVIAVLVAVAATATFGVATELAVWRPMRRRRAGALQLILMTIGLSLALRSLIQLIWGSNQRDLGVDRTGYLTALGLRIGRTELILLVAGVATLALLALVLTRTSLGRQMRALSDNASLAETSGINTSSVILVTWAFAGGLAGLAGAFYGAAVGVITPNLGVVLLLSIFAAVILGGIGNAYGALAGGLILGVAQEWAGVYVGDRWKLAVGFVVLILVLLVRPHGILGQRTGVDRS